MTIVNFSIKRLDIKQNLILNKNPKNLILDFHHPTKVIIGGWSHNGIRICPTLCKSQAYAAYNSVHNTILVSDQFVERNNLLLCRRKNPYPTNIEFVNTIVISISSYINLYSNTNIASFIPFINTVLIGGSHNLQFSKSLYLINPKLFIAETKLNNVCYHFSKFKDPISMEYEFCQKTSLPKGSAFSQLSYENASKIYSWFSMNVKSFNLFPISK